MQVDDCKFEQELEQNEWEERGEKESQRGRRGPDHVRPYRPV